LKKKTAFWGKKTTFFSGEKTLPKNEKAGFFGFM